MSWVIGAEEFAAVVVSTVVGNSIGRGGRGGPLGLLGFGVCLPLTTWDS